MTTTTKTINNPNDFRKNVKIKLGELLDNFKDGNNLELTHGLNGIRNTAKNKIQEVIGGRKDYKVDCLAAEWKDWEISWNKSDDSDAI